eukprot:313980-Rhodomonas_salina.3
MVRTCCQQPPAHGNWARGKPQTPSSNSRLAVRSPATTHATHVLCCIGVSIRNHVLPELCRYPATAWFCRTCRPCLSPNPSCSYIQLKDSRINPQWQCAECWGRQPGGRERGSRFSRQSCASGTNGALNIQVALWYNKIELCRINVPKRKRRLLCVAEQAPGQPEVSYGCPAIPVFQRRQQRSLPQDNNPTAPYTNFHSMIFSHNSLQDRLTMVALARDAG